MSEQDKQEARELADRARSQGRHAARNAGRALSHSAAAGVDELEDTAEKAVGTAKDVSRRLSPSGLASISSDAGIGFFSLSVSLYAGAIAYHKFRAVVQGRGRAVQS